jgi:BsuBI/PstI restriction endonuclease domain/BsuBI/PstI restriction endonuclease HTH domain
VRPALSRGDCEARLRQIFPRPAFPTKLANPLGGCAVAAMLYVDAVVPDEGPVDNDAIWAKPSTVLWMMDDVLEHAEDAERIAWRDAQAKNKQAVASLLAAWGIEHRPWRADTTREPLRDETWPSWVNHGAARMRAGVPKSFPGGIWALTASFAELFDPALVGDALAKAVSDWRDAHLDASDRIRIRLHRQREEYAHAVTVNLPDGQVRSLAPGDASLIIKGVVENWAPARLHTPVVLTISEPGDKFYVGDRALMESLGLTIDINNVLPDAVIVDIGPKPPVFWVIEAVATDGPISESRKAKLIGWAMEQHIHPESCRFLSAFISRNSGPARNNLKDLAVGTYAWYADEPGRELAWKDIPAASTLPANVTPIRRMGSS